MQKGIGFLMIFLGCTGLGVWYQHRYLEQVRILRQFCYILEMLEGEIRYGRYVLSECCLKLAERVGEPFKESFRQIYERMLQNTGESFGEICESCLPAKMKDVVAKPEDKEVFIQCFSRTGFQEDILQLRIIEQGKEQLTSRLREVEKESIPKCKLALGMGVMSGLLLIILLI